MVHQWKRTLFWIGLAIGFNVFIFFLYGGGKALEFFTGYIIEKSLSIDNLLIFFLIFSSFQLREKQQERVLLWGIVGAIVFRLGMILGGIALIHRFHWMTYLFGALLIGSSIRLFFQKSSGEESIWIRWLYRVIPVTEEKGGSHFFVREAGRLKATPLFLALLCIESVDVLFALDSIPAILAITTDTFIVFTSNLFAVLGLRSLYFEIAYWVKGLQGVQMALSAVLFFVGFKFITESWINVPIWASLLIVIFLLILPTCLIRQVKK